jgi:hypothetical protein
MRMMLRMMMYDDGDGFDVDIDDDSDGRDVK